MNPATACRFQRTAARSNWPHSAGSYRHLSRSRVVHAVSNKYSLVPTGDGSCEHLGGESAPKPTIINLTEGVFEVGRVAPADVVVAIPTVSSRHAIIRIEEEKIAVTDLNSTNGTMVNGTEIDPLVAANINLGDEIVFGDEHLAKFRLELAPVTTSTEPSAPADATPAAGTEPVAA